MTPFVFTLQLFCNLNPVLPSVPTMFYLVSVLENLVRCLLMPHRGIVSMSSILTVQLGLLSEATTISKVETLCMDRNSA